MLGPAAFPLSLTEPLTRSLSIAEPALSLPEPEPRVRLTRDLTLSLQLELWHAHAGDENGER